MPVRISPANQRLREDAMRRKIKKIVSRGIRGGLGRKPFEPDAEFLEIERIRTHLGLPKSAVISIYEEFGNHVLPIGLDGEPDTQPLQHYNDLLASRALVDQALFRPIYQQSGNPLVTQEPFSVVHICMGTKTFRVHKEDLGIPNIDVKRKRKQHPIRFPMSIELKIIQLQGQRAALSAMRDVFESYGIDSRRNSGDRGIFVPVKVPQEFRQIKTAVNTNLSRLCTYFYESHKGTAKADINWQGIILRSDKICRPNPNPFKPPLERMSAYEFQQKVVDALAERIRRIQSYETHLLELREEVQKNRIAAA